MRSVTFGVANSLDNFIARGNHAVDWLHYSDDVNNIIAEFWKTIDTVIMGRKTYEAAVAQGMGAYPGVKNYVVSRSLKPPTTAQFEVVSTDPAEFVRALKQQPGKGICVLGGGELARQLLEAGVVDEIGLNIQPVLLGSGIPLFYNMPAQVDLELLECRQLQHGCVYLLYRINH